LGICNLELVQRWVRVQADQADDDGAPASAEQGEAAIVCSVEVVVLIEMEITELVDWCVRVCVLTELVDNGLICCALSLYVSLIVTEGCPW
jgi:hypothetical protein